MLRSAFNRAVLRRPRMHQRISASSHLKWSHKALIISQKVRFPAQMAKSGHARVFRSGIARTFSLTCWERGGTSIPLLFHAALKIDLQRIENMGRKLFLVMPNRFPQDLESASDIFDRVLPSTFSAVETIFCLSQGLLVERRWQVLFVRSTPRAQICCGRRPFWAVS